MEETTFMADPMRLMIAALVGIIVLLVLNSTCADTSQYIIKLHANSGKCTEYTWISWKTISGTYDCNSGSNVFSGNPPGIYRCSVKKNIGSLTQSGRYDTSCYCQWRCDQMDASGFRTWKYYWSGS